MIHDKDWWMEKFGVYVEPIKDDPRLSGAMKVTLAAQEGQRILYSASDAVEVLWDKFKQVVQSVEK